jgi:hypothetical protein
MKILELTLSPFSHENSHEFILKSYLSMLEYLERPQNILGLCNSITSTGRARFTEPNKTGFTIFGILHISIVNLQIGLGLN